MSKGKLKLRDTRALNADATGGITPLKSTVLNKKVASTEILNRRSKTKSKLNYDVVVCGGGVTGLMIASKLSTLGIKCALVERGKFLADGPSTRNEGWLHRGTYHAYSIKDRARAMRVAKRCIYGHEQVRQFAPEALEDLESNSYAVTTDNTNIDELISRWKEADVQFKEIQVRSLTAANPSLKFENFANAFLVGDVAINTRILYRKLLVSAKLNKTTIYVESELASIDGDIATLFQSGDRIQIRSKLFIHATGYRISSGFGKLFGKSLPVRFWKSHLLVTGRFSADSVFFVDPNEAAAIHHGKKSITGMNEDATLVAQPDFYVTEQSRFKILTAASRLFRFDFSQPHEVVACIKVDFAENEAATRSLDISISEPIDNHLCVLPGKMTEAPYVSDRVAALVYNRLGDQSIALRPMDRLVNGSLVT